MFRTKEFLFYPETEDTGSVDTSNETYTHDSEYPTAESLKEDGAEVESDDLGEEAEESQENSVDKSKKSFDPKNQAQKTAKEMLDELTEEDKEQTEKDSEKPSEERLMKIKYNDEYRELPEKEVIEYAQKGFDYTQKTQALAKERKEVEAEVERTEQHLKGLYEEFDKHSAGFKDKIEKFDSWDYTLANIQEKRPDLFEEIKAFYDETTKLQNTPVNKALRQKTEYLEQQLSKLQKQYELGLGAQKSQSIRQGFEQEMSSIKSSILPKLSKIGLNVDLEKVKEAWIAGNDAQTTVEQALHQVYGPAITKMYESKSKLNAVKNRTQLPKGIGSAKGSKNFSGNIKDLRNRSWGAIEQDWQSYIND